MMTDQRGLYPKYKIIKNETGEEVENAFVLKPETDVHARTALMIYAQQVRDENPRLALEIEYWILACYERDGKR